MATLVTNKSQRLTFELPTNNAGTLVVETLDQVIHDDVHAPGILFGAGAFTHINTDLSSFGVDDSWAIQCTVLTADPGFDDCVIGQPHWVAGLGDFHIYNFGLAFTTATPITVRCVATRVA